MSHKNLFDSAGCKRFHEDLQAAREANDPQLWELIYFSTCDLSDPVSILTEIQRDACPRNETRDITGLLMHKSGSLVQVLEGPKCEIADIFERFILPSRKHWSVLIAASHPISERSFEGWTLACRDLENEKIKPLSEIRDQLASNPCRSAVARSLLRTFIP